MINKFENQLNLEQIEKFFAQMMNVNDNETDLRESCFIDFYVTQFYWAKQTQQYNIEQISVYFTIIHTLLLNLKVKKMSLDDNLEALQQMLVESNHRKTTFSVDELKQIISHLATTFFQQYKIYLFVINNQQDEICVYKNIQVECPKPPVETLYPPPLNEAISDQYYNKYILKIPDPQEETEHVNNELNPEINDEILIKINEQFKDLSKEEAMKIIIEVTNEMVKNLKVNHYNI
jgi:hypothetical protein